MTDKTYNGWSNYETWAVALWLDNERGSYDYWREQATRHWQDAPTCCQVQEGVWIAQDAARFKLSDQLREEVADGSPLAEASLYSDLLGAALNEVDWHEIADHLLADVDERDEGPFGPVIFA